MFNKKEIKPASVAGLFYSDNKHKLSHDLDNLLHNINTDSSIIPKAIIVPHAGYIYSGITAATAYKYFYNLPNNIENIVIFGPAHYEYFKGYAFHNAKYFNTPLGNITINQEKFNNIPKDINLHNFNKAFDKEHSIETQIPFIQKILSNSRKIIPILVGETNAHEIAKIFSYFNDNNNVFVISSDMTHFLTKTEQGIIDNETINQIENYQYQKLSGNHACGFHGIEGIIIHAKENNLTIKNIHKSNSGDITKDYNNVVGYASFIIY